MGREQRGLRSIQPEVRLVQGKPCTLKRHCLGCVRQVVGLMEKLAANDRERFVFVSQGGLLRHARKRHSQEMYRGRMVRYALQCAEGLGIIVPASRVRHGALRRGFIVAHHDEIAHRSGSRCTLRLNLRLPQRKPGARRYCPRTSATLADAKSGEFASACAADTASGAAVLKDGAGDSASQNADKCRKEFLTQCLSEPRETIGAQKDRQLASTDSFEKSHQYSPSEPSQPSQENPIKENPGNPPQAQFSNTHTSSSLSDPDYDENRRVGVDLTVGERFSGLLSGTPEQVVRGITDCEFDIDFLKAYQHGTALAECCSRAVKELSNMPFAGRTTCARVMGRSMELLREVYKLNAPTGWVPVMRQLRSSPATARISAHQIADPVELEMRSEPKRIIPPEQLLEHPGSTLNFLDSQIQGLLKRSATQNPELMQLLHETAKVRGVPESWDTALLFIEQVAGTMGDRTPPEVVRVRDELRLRV